MKFITQENFALLILMSIYGEGGGESGLPCCNSTRVPHYNCLIISAGKLRLND